MARCDVSPTLQWGLGGLAVSVVWIRSRQRHSLHEGVQGSVCRPAPLVTLGYSQVRRPLLVERRGSAGPGCKSQTCSACLWSLQQQPFLSQASLSSSVKQEVIPISYVRGEDQTLSVLVSPSRCNKFPQTRSLKQQNVFCHVPKARNSKARCRRAPSTGPRESFFLVHSSFRWLPAILEIPWSVDTLLCFLPLPSRDFLPPVSVCVQISPL